MLVDKDSQSKKILLFLGLFAFGMGLFSNYRDLWLNSNNITASSIGNIMIFASIITVLSFFLFTMKVPYKRLKEGIIMTLLLKMITSTVLLFLNGTDNYFLIKFITFFNISFEEIILGSIYPLIMQSSKSDLIYAKRDVIESIGSKTGFLLVSLFISKKIGSILINYNTCLLLSIIFIYLSFIVLLGIKVSDKSNDNTSSLVDTIKYLKRNKVLIYYLLSNILGGITWSSIIGMAMLSLTIKIGLKTNISSFIILLSGIISNILAIVIVKYFRSKNDYINLFFKYGIRICLFLLLIVTNSKEILLITFIVMYLTNTPYGFIFNSYFLHKIKEEYLLMFSTIRYSSNLIGTGIGAFICGLTFNLDIKYGILVTFVISIIHYSLCLILVKMKKNKII